MQTRFGTRRHFLAAGAAAVACGYLGGDRVTAADPFQGWPIGVQSYSLREFSAEDAIRHMQGLGIHYVELFGKHLAVDATDDQISAFKKLLDTAQIKISAHGVSGFTKDHAANQKLFEFAKRAGFNTITADPAPDSFSSLEKLVDQYKIRIAIHNHGPNHRYDKLDQVAGALEGKHPLIGACVDTGHVIRTRQDPVQWVRTLKSRVWALHIKDDIKQDGGSQNVVLGKGHLDVVGLFRALKDIQFPRDGSISLEYEANPQNPLEEMRACLDVTRDAIAKVA
jgi:sugar phosphate isomerase/epimerase